MTLQKRFLFTLVFIVLALAILEASLHAANFLITTFRGAPPDPRAKFSSYQSKPWASELFKENMEVNAAGMRYVPYVLWEAKEHSGKYLNIDAKGKRKTVNPDFPKGAKPISVYMFGGSTMYGAGARDEGTIPSFASGFLNAGRNRYTVSNYGQAAYVFTQEVMKLMLLLRNGERPDLVVFYDGANDVEAAYQAGYAGAIETEPLLKKKFEATGVQNVILGARTAMRDYCKVCRVGVNIARYFSLGAFRLYDIVGMRYSDAQIQSLAQDTAQYYTGSLSLLDNLSRSYGFKYLALWQPTMFYENHTVGDEEKLLVVDWRIKDKNISGIYKYVHADLAKISNPNFIDFSDVLKDRKEQIYLDAVHVSEEGNSIIARKIVDILNRKFKLP